jgi:hypothetical protein
LRPLARAMRAASAKADWAAEIGDGGGGDNGLIEIGQREFAAGAKVGVHGALAVRGDQDQAAGRGRASQQRGGGVMHAKRGDIAAEGLAQRVGRDLAEKSDAGAKCRRDGAAIGHRAAGCGLAVLHFTGDAGGGVGIDQGHAALGHVMAGEEGIVG